MKNMKILAIIPARWGSKSLPRKNIIKIGRLPLIAWTIKAALGSKYITKTVVTTEDKRIINIARRFGSEIIVRPIRLAKDNTPMIPVIKNCLSQLSRKGEKYDIFILLQPTSPLRSSGDIDKAFKLFFDSKATALISGYEPEKSPYKSFKINKSGWLYGLVDNKTPFMNRQVLPETFYSNGAIYTIYVKEFLKSNNLFTSRTLPYRMTLEKSVDIDSIDDVKKVSMLIKKNEYRDK